MNIFHELKHMPRAGFVLEHVYLRILMPDGWKVAAKRPERGYNSYYIYHPGTWHEFHFRWRKWRPDEIEVLDRYYNGRIIEQLKSDDQIVKFALKIRKDARVALKAVPATP